jgi:hypothetical protein
MARLSALRTGPLYPQEIFLVPSSVRDWVDPSAHSAAGRIPSGIETVTFLLVAQCLNQLRHTHPVGHIWTSDQRVAKAATYTTHNKHKRRKSLPSAGLEPAIPPNERLQTYALDSTANGIDLSEFTAKHLDIISLSFEVAIYSSTKPLYWDVQLPLTTSGSGPLEICEKLTAP